ncbi:MAG: glycosyltransferase family 2 protein [Microlunatus sp.]|nr:glycosyltransferase family 2 protein [Microlunatus sp.]
MPVLNEERHLRAAVRGVLDQRYPGELELIMAIGPCADATRQIAERLVAADPRLTIVDNPAGRTPHALNLAVESARHDILVRVDGHGELGDRYIERAVELLAETGASNVGGVMEALGKTPFEEAVAYVYTSPYGLGGAAFHSGDVPAGPAETVFLGVFQRADLIAVGGFDETMHRAQDWELNYRLRQSGRLVYFSPDLRVTYRPRSTLKALARQMYATGTWRREVVKRHPDTASPRYLAPPVAVVGIAAGTLGGLLGRLAGSRLLSVGLLAPLGYAAFVLYITATAPRSLSPVARRWLPVVLAATHLCWGSGFIVGRR